jgi:hypothetical protein
MQHLETRIPHCAKKAEIYTRSVEDSLDPTHVRLKLLLACDQWHSSRESTALTVVLGIYVETLKAELSLVLSKRDPEARHPLA